MARHYGPKFYRAIRDLRAAGFTDRPCVVRTIPQSRMPGICGRYGNGVIEIARGMDESTAADTLIHEWAHHVDMDPGRPENTRAEHRATWGAIYARLLDFYHGRA